MRKIRTKYRKVSINLDVLERFLSPGTITDIMTRYDIDDSGASRFVNALERNGLIKVNSRRRIGKHGSKTNIFIITEFGKQILNHFIKPSEDEN